MDKLGVIAKIEKGSEKKGNSYRRIPVHFRPLELSLDHKAQTKEIIVELPSDIF